MAFINDNMSTFESLVKSPGRGWQGSQPEFTDMAVSLCCSYCVCLLDGWMDALWMGSAQLNVGYGKTENAQWL